MNTHRATAAGVALGVSLLVAAVFDGHFKRQPAPPAPAEVEVIAPAPEPVVEPAPVKAPRASKPKVPAREQKARKPAVKPANVPAQEPSRRPPLGQRMTAVEVPKAAPKWSCADVRHANASLSVEEKTQLLAKATARQKAFAYSCLR